MKKKIVLISIISFLIGGLIFGSVGVVFALTYKASDIVYTPSDTSWNVNTVGEAINSLALSKTSDNYSTTEQVVGTWIDGKPLYQKTYYVESCDSSNATIAHGISNLDYYTIKDLTVIDSGNGKSFGLNEQLTTGSFAMDTSYIYKSFKNSAWGAGADIYITVQYTKTTDTAIN